MDERRATGGFRATNGSSAGSASAEPTHIDVARAPRQLGRVSRGAGRRPGASTGGRAALALVLTVGLLGCTPTSEGGGAAPGRGPAVSSGAASDSEAAALHAALTAQLEARVHLLAALSAAAAAGDIETAAAAGDAMAARRAQVAAGLLAAGVSDVDDLVDVLTVQDDLLRDHVTAASEAGRRRSRAGLVSSATRLALVFKSMTGGRLPADVGRPLAFGHLSSLLAVAADRGGAGGAAAGAVLSEALASGRLLLEPLLLALSTEEELAGSPLGDASRLRAGLGSVLLQHGFGAARVVLGDPGGEELVAGAGDRLATTLASSYGSAVAAEVRARWLEQVAATDEVVRAAVARRVASGSSQRIAADRSASLAGQRSDEAITRVADLLGVTLGDEQVGVAVRSSLAAHRRALLALSAHAAGDLSRSWPAAADAALELSELAARLASAVTRQKSLG